MKPLLTPSSFEWCQCIITLHNLDVRACALGESNVNAWLCARLLRAVHGILYFPGNRCVYISCVKLYAKANTSRCRPLLLNRILD
jgi:hypothetical protein